MSSVRRIAGYEAQEINVKLGAQRMRLALPANVDAVLSSGDDPYWAELWPSAIALSEHLLEGFACRGHRLLELGCGIGLVGVAATLCGAEVWLTDYSRTALEFARYNLRAHAASQAGYLDWHKPEIEATFDGILAADVIYDPVNWKPLLNVWRMALNAEGYILLAEPGRPDAPGFFERAEEEGYGWERVTRHVEHGDRTYGIHIYYLWREGGG